MDMSDKVAKHMNHQESDHKAKHHHHHQPPLTTTTPPLTTTTPPPPPSSTSSSPSHEFSFTISLQQPTTYYDNSKNTPHDEKTKIPPQPAPFAIDLSPADDIFFHGHLLPLHLIPTTISAPRSSIDSFTLPIKDLLHEHKSQNSNNNIQDSTFESFDDPNSKPKPNPKHKPKTSFSLFGLQKWRKGYEEAEEKQRKKLKFDMSQVLKRYMKMVRPFLSFRISNKDLNFHSKKSHSFSGNSSWRGNKENVRGKRREYSAPASMRTSPSNSGLLVVGDFNTTTTNSCASSSSCCSSSESTMEELQAAIQAAIAHCKKSIAVEDKIIK